MTTPKKEELFKKEITFIKITLENSFVLSFKDSLKLLEALEHAEIFKYFYEDSVQRIFPISDQINLETMSQEEYLLCKMNNLVKPASKESY